MPTSLTAAVALALIINASAFAYVSGTVGYDISYAQCNTSGAAPRISSNAGNSLLVSGQSVAAPRPPSPPAQSSFHSRASAPASGGTVFQSRKTALAFGIVGVDSGFPFMTTHPGNPCLAREYAQAPNPGLYVNTGYDPSYTDTTHTTASCAAQSAAINGNSDQQKAWAVGCSEAQGDHNYVQSKGITTAATWWLDVETANSWCGQPGTLCTDLSLNQYTLQGLVDTFTNLHAVPVGIYSNQSAWTQIVGTSAVIGASADWVASGTSSAAQAATYCTNSQSFSGAPVQLVQFVASGSDRDYAC